MADGRILRRARQTTRAQRAEIVDRFHVAGLSRAAFAARERISIRNLNRWLGEARRTATPAAISPPVIFGEIKLPSLPPATAEWAVEVVSARGVTVRCRERLSVAELVRLLRS